jgi:hypothetical protein
MNVVRLLAAVCLLTLGASGCDTEDPTMVVVDDDYATVPDGGDPSSAVTVYKVWWLTSLMPDPVAPGDEGKAERAVAGRDYAYAVLAPGWSPSSGSPPGKLVFARSAAPLAATRGDTLHVHVSDAAFVGNCAAGKPLAQSDADFIARQIFPAELAGLAYDAATCTVSP